MRVKGYIKIERKRHFLNRRGSTWSSGQLNGLEPKPRQTPKPLSKANHNTGR